MRTLYLIIVCFISLSVSAQTESLDSVILRNELFLKFDRVDTFATGGGVFLVLQNNKQGLYSSMGLELLPPIYDQIYPGVDYYQSYGDSIYTVKLDDKRGLFSLKNGLFLPVEHDFICSIIMSKHTLYLISKDYKLGICNARGELLIPAIYKGFKQDKSRLLFLTDSNEVKIYNADCQRQISTAKLELINMNYPEMKNFEKYEESIYLIASKNNLFGIQNTLGEELIPIRYKKDDILVENGLIYVLGDEGWTGHDFVNGQESRQVKHIELVKQGGLLISESNGKMGVIDKYGNWILPCRFDYLTYEYSRKSLILKIEHKNKFGLYSQDLGVVIPPKYDSLIRGLIDQTYYVYKDGKAGVINTKGEVIVGQDFSEIIDGMGDYFIANKKGSLGVIKVNGKTTTSFNYRDTLGLFGYWDYTQREFERNFQTFLREDSSIAVVNHAGVEIVPALYDTLIYQRNFERYRKDSRFHDYFIVKNRGMYGLISNDLELLRPVYDSLNESEFYLDSLVPISRDGLSGYLSTNDLTERIVGKYNYCHSFLGYYANVSKNGKQGLIDRYFKEKIPLNYDKIILEDRANPTHDLLFVYVEDSLKNDSGTIQYKRGLYNVTGGFEAIPAIYDGIMMVSSYYKDYYRAYSSDTDSTYVYGIKKENDQLFALKGNKKVSMKSNLFAYPSDRFGNYQYLDHNGKAAAAPINKTKKNRTFNKNFIVYPDLDSSIRQVLLESYEQVRQIPNYYLFYTTSLKAFLVKEKGKYGVVNQDNAVVIPMIYDSFEYFGYLSESKLAKGEIDGLYGCVNRKGEQVIPVIFDRIEETKLRDPETNQKLFRVEKEGKIGLIAEDGEISIPVIYEKLDLDRLKLIEHSSYIANNISYKYSLEEVGVFACEMGYEYYNNVLKLKFSDSFTELLDSIINTAPIPAKLNGKWGVLSVGGNTLIPFENDAVSFQTATLFLLEKNGQLELRNYKNENVLNYSCDSIQSLYYGGVSVEYATPIEEAAMYKVGEKYGLYDLWDGAKLDPIYDAIESCFYHHDLGWQCLFVDEIVPGERLHNSLLGHESPNCIRFKVGDKYGLIAPHGLKKVTTQLYDSIQFIRNNLSTAFVVQLNDRMTFLIDDFSRLHPTEYDSVKILNPERFYNDNSFLYEGGFQVFKHYYSVKSEGKVGLLSVEGEEILPMEYESITNVIFDEEKQHFQIIIERNGKWGLVSETGEVLIPIKYDNITLKGGHSKSRVYRFEKNGKFIDIPYNRLSRL